MKFLSKEEIVDDFISKMSREEYDACGLICANDLIQYHHTTGRGIRNHYHMWQENNPYMNHEDVNSPNHPDQASFEVLKRINERCRIYGYVDTSPWYKKIYGRLAERLKAAGC